MAPRRYILKTDQRHLNLRLDQVLAEWLPEALARPVSKGQARKLIVAGAVYLNGRRVRIASKAVMPNARVEAWIDLARLGETGAQRESQKPFELTARMVLFEDEDLIAVNKPPGLPTQPTLDEARINLFAAVKKFLAQRDGVIDPYVGLHHRLDRDTSGVMLFTKSTRANAGVAALFSEHKAQKTYQALTKVPGELPKPEWTVRNFLGKVDRDGKRARFGAVRSGGDPAHTDFRFIESGPHGLWVEARPRTGRTHQIRVHLSEAGMPILGDVLYGGCKTDPERIPRVMLHALRLTFPHPIRETDISIESPHPEDFARCLEFLRGNPEDG